MEDCGGDQSGEEIVDQHPLIVESDMPLNGFKRHARVVVHEAIMKAQKETLELADKDVFIIAGVTDNGAGESRLRRIFAVTREIGRRGDGWCPAREGFSEKELRRLTGIVKVGLILRAAAINIIQVEPWSPEVDQAIDVVLLL